MSSVQTNCNVQVYSNVIPRYFRTDPIWRCDYFYTRPTLKPSSFPNELFISERTNCKGVYTLYIVFVLVIIFISLHYTALTSHEQKRSLSQSSTSTTTLECGVRGDRGGSDRPVVFRAPAAPPLDIYRHSHFCAETQLRFLKELCTLSSRTQRAWLPDIISVDTLIIMS